MNFYHGSKQIVNNPLVNGSKPNNDYGPSFYVTMDLDSAKEWACKNEEIGIVNQYFIRQKDFESLKILDLTKKDKYSVLNWLAILMHFRDLDNSVKTTFKNRLEWLSKYYIDVSEYDVIKGFRADDAYFKFPIKFLSSTLSLENLENVFEFGHLGIQYAFMSNKAISKLKFVSSFECDEAYVGRYYHLVKKASEEFEQLINKPINDNETFIDDLIKKNKYE